MTISEYREQCPRRSKTCETVECENCRNGPDPEMIEEESLEVPLVPVIFDQSELLQRLDKIIELLEAK